MVSAAVLVNLAACKPKVPSGYIQPGDMEDLLYDFHVAQAMADENSKDEQQRAFNQTLYFASVLEKHGVTKAKFDSSLTYYYIRADKFSEIYEDVAERLSEDAKELGASEGEIVRYTKFNANGDTADVWTGDLSAMLIPYAPYNRKDFVQQADTSFRKGDSFMLMLSTEFICQSGARSAEVCIAMKYDNDTIISRAISLTTSGHSEVRIPELADHKVKEIRGFFYMPPQKEVTTTLKLLSVKDIQLIKFRKQKDEKEENDSASIRKIQPIEPIKP